VRAGQVWALRHEFWGSGVDGGGKHSSGSGGCSPIVVNDTAGGSVTRGGRNAHQSYLLLTPALTSAALPGIYRSCTALT
jgi:hypothetical protein